MAKKNTSNQSISITTPSPIITESTMCICTQIWIQHMVD